MTGATDLLVWALGPGLALALAICTFGIVLRLFEIFSLGRKTDLAVPRKRIAGAGWRTILRRSLPPPGMFRRSAVTYVGGYVFHLGLLVIVVFCAPHIAIVEDLFGVSWPGLSTKLVDAVAAASILALLMLLASRISNPVKRFLSDVQDYLVWTLTLAPLLTGYLAFHRLWLDYTTMLALHVLSAELLLVAFPFTKLFHGVSLFFSRWYNGDVFGRKGVAS